MMNSARYSTILQGIMYAVLLLLLAALLFTFIQPLHVPFLGSADQFDEDHAITSYLLMGDEEYLHFLTADEASHIQDVKRLTDIAIVICAVLGIILLCSGIELRKIRWYPAIMIILFGLLALLPFNILFEKFHQVFFPQGNYAFAYDSILITTYPQSFFVAAGICIIASYTILALIFGAIRRPAVPYHSRARQQE